MLERLRGQERLQVRCRMGRKKRGSEGPSRRIGGYEERNEKGQKKRVSKKMEKFPPTKI